jgi:hypothetical protein
MSRRAFSRFVGGKVIAALLTTGVLFAGILPPVQAETPNSLPASIQTLMAPGDTVVAFQPAKPFGAEGAGGALVVRHAQPDPKTQNACELWLLRAAGATYAVSAKNGEVVDCRYNESAKEAGAMALTHNLTVSPTSVTYFNELPRGGTTYAFAWDTQKHVWHLQHVEATSVENGEDNVIVTKSVLDYPATLPLLTIDAFSPKAIREALHSHRSVVH